MAFTDNTSAAKRANFTTRVSIRWFTRTHSTGYVGGERVDMTETTKHKTVLCSYVTSNLLFCEHSILVAESGCCFYGLDDEDYGKLCDYIRALNNKDPKTVNEHFGRAYLSTLPQDSLAEV